MYTTIEVPSPATTARSAARTGLGGAIGGLAFAASVLVQNALRSKFPTNDAGAPEVLQYYGEHRSATLALAVLMPIGLVGLTTFLGAVIARVGRGAGRAAAVRGAFGAAAVIATFTMLTALDLGIAGYVHRGRAALNVVDGIWVVHNAVFGLLLAAIGIALAGLTRAAATSGLISTRWNKAGLVGGALLVAGAMTTPAIIDASPTMFIGVAGFVVWIAFVIRTSLALLRPSAPSIGATS